MTTSDATDRERLLTAFEELPDDYRITHPALGLPLTGTDLAEWMVEQPGPAIGWHIQTDERAFGYGFPAIPWPDIPTTTPVCDRCVELNDDETTLPAGNQAAADTWRAAQTAHVIGDHHRLVDTLTVFVIGDHDLVVATLRRHGFDAHLAAADHIHIHPGPTR